MIACVKQFSSTYMCICVCIICICILYVYMICIYVCIICSPGAWAVASSILKQTCSQPGLLYHNTSVENIFFLLEFLPAIKILLSTFSSFLYRFQAQALPMNWNLTLWGWDFWFIKHCWLPWHWSWFPWQYIVWFWFWMSNWKLWWHIFTFHW